MKLTLLLNIYFDTYYYFQALTESGSSDDPLVEVMDLYEGTSEMLSVTAALESVLQKVKQPPLSFL